MRGPTHRQAEILAELAKWHGGIKLCELADRLEMPKPTLSDHLRPLRDAGKLVCVGTAHKAVWCLPEFAEAIGAQIKAEVEVVRKAYKQRQNQSYKSRRAQVYRERADTQFDTVPDMPIKRRIICADDAPALCVRAPNSVFALGAML